LLSEGAGAAGRGGQGVWMLYCWGGGSVTYIGEIMRYSRWSLQPAVVKHAVAAGHACGTAGSARGPCTSASLGPSQCFAWGGGVPKAPTVAGQGCSPQWCSRPALLSLRSQDKIDKMSVVLGGRAQQQHVPACKLVCQGPLCCPRNRASSHVTARPCTAMATMVMPCSLGNTAAPGKPACF
jgi:hypothetical protein